MAFNALAVSVPLPSGVGHCTACRANVEIDGRGRCACGLLAIWPEGQPRPNVTTERAFKLRQVDGEMGGAALRKADAEPRVPGVSGRRQGEPSPRVSTPTLLRPLTADGTRRWSIHFDACVRCGRDKYRHVGHGICHSCRATVRNQSKRDGEGASGVVASGERPHPSVTGGPGSCDRPEARLDLAQSRRAIAGSRAASSVLPEAARPHPNTTPHTERPL